MRTQGTNSLRILGATCLGLLLLIPSMADAVPSFARQTGIACQGCHTVFPELTHFGRMFKANAYTLDNLKQLRGITADKEELLAIGEMPPISAMAQIAYTSTAQPLPESNGITGSAQNGTVSFPEAASLFYAGKIAPQLGGFIQLTYDNAANKIHIDNTDIRFASHALASGERDFIFGLTLNNNPTVQDLWNTGPAFGYPYAVTNAALTPLARTQIDGTLAQNVAGLGGYLMWNESLYAEFSLYRSAKQGFTHPITGAAGPLDGTASNVVDGASPYWRLAYEHQWGNNSIEFGGYGTQVKLFPGGGSPLAPAVLSGPTNRFTDKGLDAQYQFIGDQHSFTLAGTRIHESMSLDASFAAGTAANVANSLTTTRLWGTYYFRRQYGATLARFSTKGSADALLYPAINPFAAANLAPACAGAPAPGACGVASSASGSPDTNGWVFELDYVPWMNTKLSLQLTRYGSFNGGTGNYDGFGRNASDNNTLFLLGWVAF
jgi:hypothetical protein